MPDRIDAIGGIGQSYAETLVKHGITTTERLLETCATPEGRRTVATQTGLAEHMLLRWSAHAELMRIPGVDPNAAELLEAAGVDTLIELRTRRADNLAACLERTAEVKNLPSRPTTAEVQKWIDLAESMLPLVRQ